LGETARFRSILAEYRSAPEVTRTRMYLEAFNGIAEGRHGDGGAGRPDATGAVLLLNLRDAASARIQEDAAMKRAGDIGLLACRWPCSWLEAAIFVVDQAEQAIIVQFGEPVGEVDHRARACTGRSPFIQDVRRFDKRICWPGMATSARFRPWAASSSWSTPRRAGGLPIRSSSCARYATKPVRDTPGRHHRLGGARHHLRHHLEEIVRSRDWAVDDARRIEPRCGVASGGGRSTKPKKGRERLEQEMLAAAAKQMPELGIELVDVRLKRINYIDSVRRRSRTA
jgi:hypothetical protein